MGYATAAGLPAKVDMTKTSKEQNNAEQRKRNAEKPRVSRLWSDSSGMQQSASAASQAAMGGNDSAIMDRSLDMGMASVDSNTLSKEGPRNSTLQGGMQQKAQRVHHVMSDPSLRASGPQPIIESAREPKFFGTMPRAFSETGVRCGGFQRLDWPSHNARP